MRWICRVKFVALLRTSATAGHTENKHLFQQEWQTQQPTPSLISFWTRLMLPCWKQSGPSTEANMYHYRFVYTSTFSLNGRISETKRDILSFMKKDPKREKHDSKWPYIIMTQNGPKMTFWYLGDLPGTKNDPKWEKNDPKWSYMAPNDLKRTKNDSKWPKNGPKMTFWYLGGPPQDRNLKKTAARFLQFLT